VDDLLPRPDEETARPPVKLRLEVSRREGAGWRQVATTQPWAESLSRDIWRVPPRPAQARVRTGEPLRLEAEVDRTGHLAVFNVGPTGNLNLLYPVAEYGDTPKVEAGQVLRVGELVLAPPAGRERLFAVWSSAPLPVSPAELRGLAEGKGEGRSRASRSCRDIVRVRQAVEDAGAVAQVVVLELQHEPLA
jgi:hypothetical protein